MTVSDWLVIAAIVVAPVLAVRIQKFIDNRKQEKDRKMQVFRTLMTTRATPLSPLHVESLNMIDIEFYDNKEVVESWKLLLDNFVNYPQDTKAPSYEADLNACTRESAELLTDLLHEMAKSLGYSFDKVHLKRGAYIPKGHADMVMDQEIIRRSLIGVLLGKLPIPIRIADTESNQNKTKETEPEKA